MPALKAELPVKTPADRNLGKRWVAGEVVPVVSEAIPGAAIRLGYARCSTVGQELQSQLDVLARADCTRVFSEKISTRVKERPELEKALALAQGQPRWTPLRRGRRQASHRPCRARQALPPSLRP
ncbi:recombinase family protein [Streptomyces sp. NPDC088789]|uniref:recombinase family protein n=1 Tax=Streptomyces sp. NPDC088789 TaxID=3365899 RepID=UPI003830C91C